MCVDRRPQKDLELVVPSIGVVPAATSENGAKSEQHASESGEVAVPGKRKRDGSAAGSNPDSRRPSMTGQRPRLKSWQVLRRLARHDVKAFAEVATARLSDADVVQFAACAVVGSSDLPKPAKVRGLACGVPNSLRSHSSTSSRAAQVLAGRNCAPRRSCVPLAALMVSALLVAL